MKNEAQKNSQGPPMIPFHADEDKICTLGLHRYGYGQWEIIRNDIRNSPSLMFNWIARSRTPQDIQKRCDMLIAQFKKEFDI
jgi:SWI/SNF-related matrix-associated actin-dependent regulator of chromatin subfamily A member 5